jgi:hypothetical protein
MTVLKAPMDHAPQNVDAWHIAEGARRPPRAQVTEGIAG